MTAVEQRRVVVTGVNGFVGGHLVRELHNSGLTVVGIARDEAPHEGLNSLLEAYYRADLTQEWPQIAGRVDAVINLAGYAAVAKSFEPGEADVCMQTNTGIMRTICEYYADIPADQRPRIVAVSTGAIYDPDQPMPQTEDSAFKETSPYAASKIAAEAVCQDYIEAGLDIVIARPLNHTGPDQGKGFLVPDKIAQLKEHHDQGLVFSLAGLNATRDFTDVRDIVVAYRLLATQELAHAVYNVCSGVSTPIWKVVEELARLVGTAVDDAPSANEVGTQIYGDNTRIRTDLGWEPSIPLAKTLADAVAES